MSLPAKLRDSVTISWYIDCPMIIFHIRNVIKGADFGSGNLSNRLGVGGSVASARAANVSMIRLTQSN